MVLIHFYFTLATLHHNSHCTVLSGRDLDQTAFRTNILLNSDIGWL